ncbi:hypothetical protein Agub_g9013, partial [Astrephomene gubernaculifera]
CELCGVVSHASCCRAVPHSCRLLALAAPLPAAGAEATEAAGGAGAGPLPPLPHDWRPAGTTLDLLLPPADAEMLLSGGAPPPHDPTSPTPTPTPSSSSPPHGPPSLCLYCGAPCEVGLLAVEPVWRCAGCRRFAHVMCWCSLHPGALSAGTRA